MRLRLPTVLTALAATVAATALTGAPAHAEAWNIPRDARITFVGHGYGHGHGMSQYGAEGAARRGLDHRQIMNFYYPGTSWGTATGPIRVLLKADTTPDVVVVNRKNLVVRDLATRAATRLPANGATRWRLTPNGARTNVAYLSGSRWRFWRTLTGEAEFGANGAPIALVTPSGTHRYRGTLRSAAATAGSADRRTINVLSLENYLRGVVPFEMPALWSPEAVQSQAVAARTYAAYERDRPVRHYDICDTTSCQVYGGYDGEHTAANAAIAATAGQVLTYGGKAAFTQFSASSGGWMSAGSMPYLVAKQDPYDDWSGNPVHDWSAAFADERVERAFPAIGNLTRIEVTRRDGNGDWGGRVLSITFTGSSGRATVSGDDVRSRFGLRSNWFTVRVG